MPIKIVNSDQLRKGDIVIRAGDTIPCDGEVEGGASVDERNYRGVSSSDP